MASKSKKSARGSTPAMQTPVGPSASSSGSRSTSPLSPTRHNRLQEKVELQNLNDRLAVYIDRVRQLETENSRLSREITTYQETSTREVTSIKCMYEQEIAEARKLLDETSKERAKMEIDMKRMWEENDEMKNKLDKKTKDCATYEKSSTLYESRFNDISGKYNQAQSEKKKLADENKEHQNLVAVHVPVKFNIRPLTEQIKLPNFEFSLPEFAVKHFDKLEMEKELEKLKKTLDNLRKLMDQEMLSRVEAENRLQTIKEELSLKEQVHNQELKEVRTKRQVEISELDNRLVEEYNAKLQLSLQELRDQYELQMRANRDDIEVLYENKMRDLKNQMQKNNGAAAQAIDEMRQYKMQLDSVAGKISSLESSKASLNARVQELERMLELERERYNQNLAQSEAENQRMREEMASQLSEYQDLMDIKVALDLEIAAYHKLLESEEARLNIIPMQSPTSQRFTPVRRTPGPTRGGKRKRTIFEESEEHAMDEFGSNSSAKGDVEISEGCAQGRYVKLHNKGNKEAALGGWQLVRKAGDKETSFKFHRTVKVDPGATITVWSSDQGQTHEPPSNIVMKGQKWFVANTMTTTLHNNDGEDMATLEQQRQQLSTTASRHRELTAGDEELYFQRGDPQGRDERCSIM